MWYCGYLSGARCRLFAYGPADATAFPKPRHLLPHLNPDWFYLSGTGLPRLYWKTGAVVVVLEPFYYISKSFMKCATQINGHTFVFISEVGGFGCMGERKAASRRGASER